MKVDIKAEGAKGQTQTPDLWDKSDGQTVGTTIVKTIVKRTQEGSSAEGSGFKPYSKAYAKRKGSSRVDLKASGNLLRSIQVVEVTDSTVTVGVTGSAAEYASAVDEDRPFLGLTAQEAEKVLDQIVAEMDRSLAGSGKAKGPVV